MPITTIDHHSLRQRFNPDGSLLRRQQLRMLEILVEIDRICQRHQIPYWLSSGTLIGAVRHDGFIPWDDDLDIEMLRSDYLRLMDVLPRELPDWLALQRYTTDANYFFFYAKVRDRRSKINEGNNYDRAWKEQGIYIDIFPMEKQNLWLHRLSEKSVGHMYKIWRTSRDDQRSIRRVRTIFDINRRFVFPVIRFLNKLFAGSVITSGLGIPFHNPRFEKDIFPLGAHVFEDRSFPVPHDYDHHLRCIYGDYTQLPNLDNLQLHTDQVEIYD
jgi:lipopolysaccharide cholinephosphotransferase